MLAVVAGLLRNLLFNYKLRIMRPTRFVTLTYAGNYIDYNLLANGLYSTSAPKLFDASTTIEDLVKQGQKVVDLTGNQFIEEGFFNNLKMCSMTLVELSVVK